MDALLATVHDAQRHPRGHRGASNGAKNAAILAVEILALSEPELAEKLEPTRRKQTAQAHGRDQEVMEKYRQQ